MDITTKVIPLLLLSLCALGAVATFKLARHLWETQDDIYTHPLTDRERRFLETGERPDPKLNRAERIKLLTWIAIAVGIVSLIIFTWVVVLDLPAECLTIKKGTVNPSCVHD